MRHDYNLINNSILILHLLFIGAIIIVTGLFSVAFLGSKLQLHKWLGIFSVVLGLAVIGICDYMYSNDANSDTNGIIAGFFFNEKIQIYFLVEDSLRFI